MQETWLTAIRQVKRFDPEQGSFAGWLRGIAANVLRNHFRRETRRNNHAALGELREAVACPADTELEKRECAERVARALASLPERYEAVLQAKYLDGQGVAEIAAAWKETTKAVESLLTRARLAFRAAYQELD